MWYEQSVSYDTSKSKEETQELNKELRVQSLKLNSVIPVLYVLAKEGVTWSTQQAIVHSHRPKSQNEDRT